MQGLLKMKAIYNYLSTIYTIVLCWGYETGKKMKWGKSKGVEKPLECEETVNEVTDSLRIVLSILP